MKLLSIEIIPCLKIYDHKGNKKQQEYKKHKNNSIDNSFEDVLKEAFTNKN